MLLRACLSLPQRIGKRPDDFGMFLVKLLIERHVRVLDMAADKALEPMRANLFLVGVSDYARTAVGGFCPCARCRNRQRRDQIRPLDGERLNDLTAEREACSMTAGDFQIF